MKGIILAGGTGSRLYPLTKIINKHLLPVFNKPMIYYPIESLVKAGITEILIVSGKGHAGQFLELLGSGKELGVKLSYAVQEEAGGIAQALSLAKDFAENDKVIVYLGDNILEDDITEIVNEFKNTPIGAKILLKEVKNPSSYGIAKIVDNKIEEIVEKPKEFVNDLAVIGVYMYDNQVWDIIKTLKPSGRGELEITDVNNFYVKQGTMNYKKLDGWWGDCGESFESLLEANNLVAGFKKEDAMPIQDPEKMKIFVDKIVEKTLKLAEEEITKKMDMLKTTPIQKEEVQLPLPQTLPIIEEKIEEKKPDEDKKEPDSKYQHPFDINSYYSKT